jgi:hypothetical protein
VYAGLTTDDEMGSLYLFKEKRLVKKEKKSQTQIEATTTLARFLFALLSIIYIFRRFNVASAVEEVFDLSVTTHKEKRCKTRAAKGGKKIYNAPTSTYMLMDRV